MLAGTENFLKRNDLKSEIILPQEVFVSRNSANASLLSCGMSELVGL
jgi:hypothetical protein